MNKTILWLDDFLQDTDQVAADSRHVRKKFSQDNIVLTTTCRGFLEPILDHIRLRRGIAPRNSKATPINLLIVDIMLVDSPTLHLPKLSPDHRVSFQKDGRIEGFSEFQVEGRGLAAGLLIVKHLTSVEPDLLTIPHIIYTQRERVGFDAMLRSLPIIPHVCSKGEGVDKLIQLIDNCVR